MTHDQLARRVAARQSISIRDSRRVLDAYAAELAAALRAGQAVTIAGVGTITPPSAEGGRTRLRRSAGTGPQADDARNADCDGPTPC